MPVLSFEPDNNEWKCIADDGLEGIMSLCLMHDLEVQMSGSSDISCRSLGRSCRLLGEGLAGRLARKVLVLQVAWARKVS